MAKAIGMTEYQTVSTGVEAADLMIKTAEVDVIEAQVVCPGTYMILITLTLFDKTNGATIEKMFY